MAQEARAVLVAWRAAFGAEAVTAADAIQRADPNPAP